MKIMVVNNSADLYGASRCLLRLTRELVYAGNEVVVVVPVEGPLTSELSLCGCRVILQSDVGVIERKQLGSFWKKLKTLVALPRTVTRLFLLFRRYKPDVIHTNTSVIFGSALAAFVARIPHVWHVRETYFEYLRTWRIYRHILLFFSAKIIVISKSVLSQFDRSSLYKVTLIYDGLSKDEFRGVSTERLKEFRKAHSIPNCEVVGVIGRIKWHRKGQEVLVRAANLIRSKFPEVRFVIVGSPFPGNEEHLRRLNQLILEYKLNDYFIFTGDIHDVEVAFACMTITVVPSVLAEPFGCVVLESMMIGVPVIGSNIGGIAEQVSHRNTGLLFEPGNHAELAIALNELLGDRNLRARLVQNAKAQAVSKYDLCKSVDLHLQCYREALNR